MADIGDLIDDEAPDGAIDDILHSFDAELDENENDLASAPPR